MSPLPVSPLPDAPLPDAENGLLFICQRCPIGQNRKIAISSSEIIAYVVSRSHSLRKWPGRKWAQTGKVFKRNSRFS